MRDVWYGIVYVIESGIVDMSYGACVGFEPYNLILQDVSLES